MIKKRGTSVDACASGGKLLKNRNLGLHFSGLKKVFTYFVLSVFLFYNCTFANQKGTQHNLINNLQVDTLPKFSLLEISKNEYRKLYKSTNKNKIDPLDTTKINGLIELHLSDGSIKTFRDSLYQNDELSSFKNYSLGYYPDINYFLIFTSFYEGGKFKLINKSNGKEYSIWNPPIISPNNKKLISYQHSLIYPILPNGIQFFEMNNNDIKLLWEFKTDEWEPTDIVWLNDTELLLEKSFPNFQTNTVIKKYYKMFLKN